VVLELSGDELVLVIVALVRAVNPAMLKAEKGDFTVDFTPLQDKKTYSSDEQLLIKLRVAAESEATKLDLQSNESQRLAACLERLETLQSWPADVLKMSRSLRARLSTVV